MTTTAPPTGAAAPAGAYRASTRQNLVTIAFGWWLVLGLFVDGWAHNQFGETLETFFTPWHALFYSGFLAVAGWCLLLASQGWRQGRRGLAAFPDGYHLAALGVPIFGLGGLGDLSWHTVFGIEVGIEALLSPTHLLLFAGAVLILGSPLNAAWRTPTGRRAPAGVRWVATLAAASLLAVTAFMHMYLWGLMVVPQGLGWVQTRGELSAILLTALILAAPVLLLLRRFELPFGAITLMYVLTHLGLSAMLTPGDGRVPLVALVTGLLADVLAAWLRPSPARVWAWRAFAFLLPLGVWAPYLGGAARLGLSNLSLELWLGVAVMTGLGGLALSVLLLPPPLPREARAEEG
ncbi:hypothetical protein SAMN04488058_10126 [Deinococcus reticulitermitis]|uniref:Uncharacterized protein n=1 Tax=Deinococcus reticulitermitis TaxID=856736 RepID=A0A1H6S2L4_9DEIO|nr:hypothetical protein [Deinococcus reticulitermitis]SEI57682.1 hypothetical protein SAMN04488058_10126 [Deinococcus reticulitermitis]